MDPVKIFERHAQLIPISSLEQVKSIYYKGFYLGHLTTTYEEKNDDSLERYLVTFYVPPKLFTQCALKKGTKKSIYKRMRDWENMSREIKITMLDIRCQLFLASMFKDSTSRFSTLPRDIWFEITNYRLL